MSVLVAARRILVPLCSRSITVCAARLKVFDVTSAEQFKTDVIESKQPVIVDFHASWCEPCKEMYPDLESVANELSLDVAKVDVDAMLDLSMEYHVTAVPTVMAISNGEVADQFVGLETKEFIADFMKKLVKT